MELQHLINVLSNLHFFFPPAFVNLDNFEVGLALME